MLNNDTIVPPGWLARLLLPLDEPRLGLIGSATNRTCNEAQIDRDYTTYGDYLALARASAAAFDGQTIPIRMLAMFCTAFRRDLYETIGPFDERYEHGMFEDEDYALAPAPPATTSSGCRRSTFTMPTTPRSASCCQAATT